MTNRTAITALCAVALAAVSVAGAAVQVPAPPPGSRTLHVAGGVDGIAADGERVAVSVSCKEMSVWSPTAGRSVPVPGSGDCVLSRLGALAGTRLIWLQTVVAANQYEYVDVKTAVAGGGKPVGLNSFEMAYNGSGPQVGKFAGDGDLLVYAAWTGAEKGGAVTGARVVRVDGGRQRIIRRFPGEIVSVSVDGGRIAVAEPEGVSLLDRNGKLLRAIQPGLAEIDAVALQGSQLAVAGSGEFVVYDAATGRRLRELTLPEGGRLDDLANGVAVVLEHREGTEAIHVVRIADGRDVVVSLAEAAGAPGDLSTQIEPAGLTYAYGDDRGGHVVFVPWQALQRFLAANEGGQYRRAAAAACAEVVSGKKGLSRPETYYQDLLALFVRELARLRQLDPPASLARLHARALDLIDQGNALLRRLIARIRQGADPVAAWNAMGSEFERLDLPEYAVWTKLGVPVCSMGSEGRR